MIFQVTGELMESHWPNAWPPTRDEWPQTELYAQQTLQLLNTEDAVDARYKAGALHSVLTLKKIELVSLTLICIRSKQTFTVWLIRNLKANSLDIFLASEMLIILRLHM